MAEVFLSYSRKDRKWVDRLKDALKPLLRQRNILLWSDAEISPGEDWLEAISSSLDRSQIVILLISADYLASGLVDKELPLILERSSQGKLRVFSVIVSPALEPSPDVENFLKKNKLINSFSEPLSALSEYSQKEIFMRVSDAIDSSLPTKSNSEKLVEKGKDKYSAALNTAITKIGGNTIGINLFGDGNIFFEAEEKLEQKNG